MALSITGGSSGLHMIIINFTAGCTLHVLRSSLVRREHARAVYIMPWLATCDVHAVGAKPDTGVHNRGAKLGVRARACNDHFCLLHHPVNGCLVCGISHKDWHILHCKGRVMQ